MEIAVFLFMWFREGMDDVDAQIIADRNRDIQQLDRDMEDLAEVYQVALLFFFYFFLSVFVLWWVSVSQAIMQEVNMMVNQQGEQLDMASDNVMTAETNVSQAREHLQTSEKVLCLALSCCSVVL